MRDPRYGVVVEGERVDSIGVLEAYRLGNDAGRGVSPALDRPGRFFYIGGVSRKCGNIGGSTGSKENCQ